MNYSLLLLSIQFLFAYCEIWCLILIFLGGEGSDAAQSAPQVNEAQDDWQGDQQH